MNSKFLKQNLNSLQDKAESIQDKSEKALMNADIRNIRKMYREKIENIEKLNSDIAELEETNITPSEELKEIEKELEEENLSSSKLKKTKQDIQDILVNITKLTSPLISESAQIVNNEGSKTSPEISIAGLMSSFSKIFPTLSLGKDEENKEKKPAPPSDTQLKH